MNTHSKNRGFTLIELLVVIAIIGILSSVVLASLNSARAKGANASVKSNLANIRAQAELVYDNTTPNQYGNGAASGSVAVNNGSCTTANSLFANAQIAAAITSANNAGGGGATGANCNSTIGASSAYAISIQLKTPEGTNTHWCVDSTGASKGRTSALPNGTVAC